MSPEHAYPWDNLDKISIQNKKNSIVVLVEKFSQMQARIKVEQKWGNLCKIIGKKRIFLA